MISAISLRLLPAHEAPKKDPSRYFHQARKAMDHAFAIAAVAVGIIAFGPVPRLVPNLE
jgi:hypothetical protein